MGKRQKHVDDGGNFADDGFSILLERGECKHVAGLCPRAQEALRVVVLLHCVVQWLWLIWSRPCPWLSLVYLMHFLTRGSVSSLRILHILRTQGYSNFLWSGKLLPCFRVLRKGQWFGKWENTRLPRAWFEDAHGLRIVRAEPKSI